MGPLVSIVIPCYNEESYIGECLQSIVDQSYLPDLIEVIVVDGNSTDKSMSIVQKYIKILPHLTQLMNPQIITPISLNIGVKSASGKIIIILGAHSFIHKDFIKSYITHIQRSAFMIDNSLTILACGHGCSEGIKSTVKNDLIVFFSKDGYDLNVKEVKDELKLIDSLISGKKKAEEIFRHLI